jgi:hypothetical protein
VRLANRACATPQPQKLQFNGKGNFFKVMRPFSFFLFVFYEKDYLFTNDNKSTSDHSLLAKFKIAAM